MAKKGIKDLAWHEKNKVSFEKVFKKLNKYGIFVVPQGGLESWVGRDKNWPYSAAQKIMSKPEISDFKKFSGEILDYLLGKIKHDSKKHSKT